ncbi:RNA polymerase sigma factor [Siphonobacter sp. SORGH_AS_0500]|uniref:RNA polymerase sigma factor n=1 Tax=Siphonobacter sp. SORGH_AS_0500 TaxID=1864824 RepID=UPI000CA71746|nr:RNA polymerase sigma factor [Siphonobacter sp. SORGH_AS_0500]MDR6193692.1 RNA polymerase sigma factor (sigma-70 family) [Siphonobacter sp. SORGH_AS_0500]PKK36560.1 RNA polymerase [Siphonobacter sp. SORGH_AS_0500]
MEQTLYIDRHYSLVEACKRGDRKAQYELYRLYSKSMFNVCMRILNHMGEAEDVLQEAFLDAFQKIHDFRQTSTFGAWLKQIVVNRAINQLRQRKLEWVDVEEADSVGEEVSIPQEETDWEIERVRLGIQQLPDGFRTVLSLYLLEGYDHEEIANILNISESTSRTQYMRAKRKLVELLTE